LGREKPRIGRPKRKPEKKVTASGRTPNRRYPSPKNLGAIKIGQIKEVKIKRSGKLKDLS